MASDVDLQKREKRIFIGLRVAQANAHHNVLIHRVCKIDGKRRHIRKQGVRHELSEPGERAVVVTALTSVILRGQLVRVSAVGRTARPADQRIAVALRARQICQAKAVRKNAGAVRKHDLFVVSRWKLLGGI